MKSHGRIGGLPLLLPVLIKVAPILVEFFSKLFGGKWNTTTGVRWLTAYYQYYVLGDAGATGSTKVNEGNTIDAQSWFAVVTGVPIYDRYRIHALMGTNPADGAPLGKPDAQRAADYLALGTDTRDIDPKAVAQAVQIVKRFKWGTAPGSWEQFSVEAPSVLNTGGGGNGSGTVPQQPTDDSQEIQPGGVMEFIKANPVGSALLAGLLVYGVYVASNKK